MPLRKNAQPDWDHVRVFLAVARSGRVAVAARRLGVQHTTISRQLATLETELGAQLFYRTASGYLLTAAGESILATAESMEQAAVAIGARISATLGKLSGRVRVWMPPEFASDWLAPELPKFRTRYPGLELLVLVGTRTLDLSRAETELAVQGPRPVQTGLVTLRIGRSAMRLYASRAFVGRKTLRITDAESAQKIPLLVYTPQFQVLQKATWFQAALSGPNVVMQSNSTHLLLSAAQASVGVAVLPQFVARRYDDLVAVSDVISDNDMWLVTHPEFRRDPKVRAVADFLKEIAKTGMI
ncbi:MAG: LysR family transcriptional regulator [Phycisphaerae bacterium]|nr:LysR family transcriptional regulator [Gemmatimonadaceae bacterium]